MPVPASAYCTVTVLVLAGIRVTVKVRLVEPLSPSVTLGELIDSVDPTCAAALTANINDPATSRLTTSRVARSSPIMNPSMTLGISWVKSQNTGRCR